MPMLCFVLCQNNSISLNSSFWAFFDVGEKLAFLLEIILLVNRELIRTLRPKMRLSHTMRNYPAVQAKPTETEPCFITNSLKLQDRDSSKLFHKISAAESMLSMWYFLVWFDNTFKKKSLPIFLKHKLKRASSFHVERKKKRVWRK